MDVECVVRTVGLIRLDCCLVDPIVGHQVFLADKHGELCEI